MIGFHHHQLPIHGFHVVKRAIAFKIVRIRMAHRVLGDERERDVLGAVVLRHVDGAVHAGRPGSGAAGVRGLDGHVAAERTWAADRDLRALVLVARVREPYREPAFVAGVEVEVAL